MAALVLSISSTMSAVV